MLFMPDTLYSKGERSTTMEDCLGSTHGFSKRFERTVRRTVNKIDVPDHARETHIKRKSQGRTGVQMTFDSRVVLFTIARGIRVGVPRD